MSKFGWKFNKLDGIFHSLSRDGNCFERDCWRQTEAPGDRLESWDADRRRGAPLHPLMAWGSENETHAPTALAEGLHAW